MDYKYTAYYENAEERIKAISEEILSEYPNLGILAIEAAKLETPFGRVNADYENFIEQENHINRLINIVIVTEGKLEFQEEYRKACADLLKNYASWEKCFSYANPQEQAVYMLMQKFNVHIKHPEVPLMTYKEALDEQRKRCKEKNLKRAADVLRSKIPGLGAVADEVIRQEDESGIHLRFQENDIIRLVSIIKLIENKPEYADAYNNVLEQLKETYAQWLECETRVMWEEKHMVVEMMNRFSAHLEDKNAPIVTYEEIKKEFEEVKKRR